MPIRGAVAPLDLFVDYFGESPGPDAGPREFWEQGADALNRTETDRLPTKEGFIISRRDSGDFESFERRVPTASSEQCSSCFERLYFLTHVHEDNMQGLTSNWKRGFICCSAASQALILLHYPSLLSVLLPLQLDTPYVFLVHTQALQKLPQHSSSTDESPTTCQRMRNGNRSPSKHQRLRKRGLRTEMVSIDSIPPCCSGSRDSFNKAILDIAASSARNGINRTRCFSCGAIVDSVHVRLVDARHCPGSVILILRGNSFGTLVHTGDFCCNRSTRDNIVGDVKKAIHQLQSLVSICASVDTAASTTPEGCEAISPQAPRLKEPPVGHMGRSIEIHRKVPCVDVLFIDNTYLHPKFTFEDETSVAQQVSCFIYKALTHYSLRHSRPPQKVKSRIPVVVLVGTDGLGREGLLSRIASQFGVQVELSHKRFDAVAAAARAAAIHYSIRHFRRGYSWKHLAYAVGAPSRNIVTGDIPRQPLVIAAVPGGQLFRLLEDLSSPSVYVVGVLPSGHSAFDFSKHQGSPGSPRSRCGFFNYSLHSSFPDLCYFVKDLLPRKVVLLKPLPTNKMSRASCSNLSQATSTAVVITEKPQAADCALSASPGHLHTGETLLRYIKGQRDTSAPGTVTTADTLRVLRVACELRREMTFARTSGALPVAASAVNGSSVAMAVFRHLLTQERSILKHETLSYDGEEGLMSFVRSTGASCVILGRGRKFFHLLDVPNTTECDSQHCRRVRQQPQSHNEEHPEELQDEHLAEQFERRTRRRMLQAGLHEMIETSTSNPLPQRIGTLIERLQEQRFDRGTKK